ncbi:MAG: NAD(P)/FAD-dependent oxidoreductase [bacterium]
MAENYDVVIAGAGVAGCLAARDLAKLGYQVAVVERQPREHMGHDWWDSVHLDVFEEVGLPAPEPPELMVPTGLTIAFSPLETVKMTVPANYEKTNIDRRPFAQRLIKYAEDAGARLFFKTAVLAPILENGAVKGLIARDKDKNELRFNGRITIDASGITAALRKKTSDDYGYTRFIDRSEMFVTHREIRPNTDGSEANTMVFGKNNGVIWVKRGQPGLVDVFAGVINFKGRVVPREIVGEILDSEKGIGPKIIRGGYGAPIPVRRCFDSFVAPGLILAGDSACQCNPIDGSGICSSLRAASFAAKTIHASLSNGAADVESLWPYNAAYIRTQGAKFAALHIVQKFMTAIPKPSMESLFSRGIISPKVFWGGGSVQASGSKFSMILKMLKLIDKPALIGDLMKMGKTVKEIDAHYKNYPEKFDAAQFESWRRHTEELFSRFKPVA